MIHNPQPSATQKVVMLIIALLLVFTSKAQTVSYGKVMLKESTTINLKKITKIKSPVIVLAFKVNKINKGDTVRLNIQDDNGGTAQRDSDYSFDKQLSGDSNFFNDFGNGDSQPYNIGFNKISTKKKTTCVFFILVRDKGKAVIKYKVTVQFNSGDTTVSTIDTLKASTLLPDTSKWSFTIVTGGNFSFFSGPTIKNFAGDLNFFMPNIYKRFGLQFGIFNFQYNQSDSSGQYRNYDYYYLKSVNAFNQFDTAKVVRRQYSVQRSIVYNVWGGYIEPFYQLDVGDSFVQTYLSLHVEGLITTQTYSPKETFLSRDTFTYKYNTNPQAPLNNSLIAANAPVYPSYFNSTYYDFYYGLGFPIKINFKNQLKISLATYIGAASFEYENPNGPNSSLDFEQRFTSGNKYYLKGFCLAKYQIITTIAPLDIALGGEYRSVFGQTHYFANYIGVGVSFDKLKK